MFNSEFALEEPLDSSFFLGGNLTRAALSYAVPVPVSRWDAH
jgi:hypothetical protein